MLHVQNIPIIANFDKKFLAGLTMRRDHIKLPPWLVVRMLEAQTYFFLFLGVDGGGAWGGMTAASLRGLPRGRLSVWAGLPVDVAPTLLDGGEGPWSEGSTVLSSDDILNKWRGGDNHAMC